MADAAKSHVPRCAPLPHDRLLPLLWRRISLGVYRRSPRHARWVTVHTEDPLPSLHEMIAVYLAERLPAAVVCRLEISGLLWISGAICIIMRAVAMPIRAGLWVARRAWRLTKRIRSAHA